jgi:hypothetical protein
MLIDIEKILQEFSKVIEGSNNSTQMLENKNK